MVMGVTIYRKGEESLEELRSIDNRLSDLYTRMTNLESKFDQILSLLNNLQQNNQSSNQLSQTYPNIRYPKR